MRIVDSLVGWRITKLSGLAGSQSFSWVGDSGMAKVMATPLPFPEAHRICTEQDAPSMVPPGNCHSESKKGLCSGG